MTIKQDFVSNFLRCIGVFMIFVLTSCPIKASIKQNVFMESTETSTLPFKQTKISNSLTEACVTDLKETLQQGSVAISDFTPVVLLLLFLGFLSVVFDTVRALVYPRWFSPAYSRSLLVFFNRFNL